MEIFLGWIIFSFVAGAIGSSRKIGFAGAFFLSLLLSPLIGMIIALASKRKDTENFEKQLLKNSIKTPEKNYIDELYKLQQLLNSGAIDSNFYQRERNRLESSRTYNTYFYDSTGKGRQIIAKGMERLVKLPKNKEDAVLIKAYGKVFEIVVQVSNPLYFKDQRYSVDLSDFEDGYIDLSNIEIKIAHK